MAISTADKLNIYNGALRKLGSRRLASLSENREPRRVLDDIWGSSDERVKLALEKGEWNFALRSLKVAPEGSVAPSFGFSAAFARPTDFRRLASLCSDEYFRHPLTNNDYSDEGGYWLSDATEIYVRYVSDDDAYGLDSSRWTESFKEYLQAFMAWEACERITNSTALAAKLEKAMKAALSGAKSNDTFNDGVKFLPQGSWSLSRSRGRSRDTGQP